jgi:site-specific recombinase XerC
VPCQGRHPQTVTAITRDDVRAFIADQLDRWKPLTALNRYRSLQVFFKWAVAEGELNASPMVGMNPPAIPDEPPAVLSDDRLRRLLKSCEGGDFTARRDTAIIRLFLDTGVRVREAAGITLSDLDLDDQVVVVLGKGRRPGRSRSAARPHSTLTATFGRVPASRSPICRTCGSNASAP